MGMLKPKVVDLRAAPPKDEYEGMRYVDLGQPSWITKPAYQWAIGIIIVALILAATAVPIGLVMREQASRSDGIERAAVAVVCGNSKFVDEITKPAPIVATDPETIARIQAVNEQRAEARRLFRAHQPAQYLKQCDLAP